MKEKQLTFTVGRQDSIVDVVYTEGRRNVNGWPPKPTHAQKLTLFCRRLLPVFRPGTLKSLLLCGSLLIIVGSTHGALGVPGGLRDHGGHVLSK